MVLFPTWFAASELSKLQIRPRCSRRPCSRRRWWSATLNLGQSETKLNASGQDWTSREEVSELPVRVDLQWEIS